MGVGVRRADSRVPEDCRYRAVCFPLAHQFTRQCVAEYMQPVADVFSHADTCVADTYRHDAIKRHGFFKRGFMLDKHIAAVSLRPAIFNPDHLLAHRMQSL